MLSGQMSPLVAKTIGVAVWNDAKSAVSTAIREARSRVTAWPWEGRRGESARQQNASVADRASAVDHFRLCPRHVELYVGEDFDLVPLPLDIHESPVNGVVPAWTTSDQSVATVTNVGEVAAVAPGNAMVTATVGRATARVMVTVLGGHRPRQTDADWDNGHSHDCDGPEGASLNNNEAPPSQLFATDDSPAAIKGTDAGKSAAMARGNLRHLVSPAGYKVHTRRALGTAAGSGATSGLVASPAAAPLQILDGGSGDATFSRAAATAPNNAIGSPRFAAKESTQGAGKIKNLLGSSNYVFAAPVLSLPGRGIATNLAMVYNSQLWSMQPGPSGNTMFFDLNKSWPAPGWTLGYGRLIPNYNGTATGDASGNTVANYPGDYLLIQPDGTRIPLTGTWLNPTGFWYTSNDGNFIQFNFVNNKIWYPDGTAIRFNWINNRVLPVVVQTRNGDQISIAYRTKSATFPVRVAIDHIIDTLGRSITFNYYGDTNFPADTGAHPSAALASVTVIDRDGSSTRTLIQLDYRTLTFNYSYTNVDASTPAGPSTMWVLNSITYPQTGRGYTFPDQQGSINGYSAYGMIRRISVRQGMLGPTPYGTEVASTLYNYPDVGHSLPDVPQYTTRTESWTGTDLNGNAAPMTGTYSYSLVKSADGLTETSTVTAPDQTVTTNIICTDSTAGANFGNVLSTTITSSSGLVLSSASYGYGSDSGDGSGNGVGVQLVSSTVATDGGPSVTTNYSYGLYGRLMTLTELGYGSTALRKTKYAYVDDPNYTNVFLDRLVAQVLVIDGTTSNTLAETLYAYDAASPGLGPTYATQAPNHDYAHFDTTNLVRGNVTSTTQYVNITTGQTIVQTAQYDIFGNVTTASASCCQQKKYTFSGGTGTTWYSQPDSETDGPSGGPNLITTLAYNSNTSELTSMTNPNNVTTSYSYDNAWRPSGSTTTPSTSTTTVGFDKDGSGNDLLSNTQQVQYLESDGVTQKTLTNKSFFDGAGHTIRAGAGAGTSPTSLDTVATVYDNMGRVSAQTNPYSGAADGTTSATIKSTTNTYDGLGRVTQVTLPDIVTPSTNFVITNYTGVTGQNPGNVTKVTDQVGRQRQSISDGLGRTAKVFEQDPSTGNLTLETDYTYDMLDNLTQVNQGGQIRTFGYDAMSRVTSVTTPEAGTVTYQYDEFSHVTQRNDARGVQTIYSYDGLNRLYSITYPATPPAGVAGTTNVTIQYNTASPGNGQPYKVTDGAGTETYGYDNIGRLTSKTRTIDGNGYTTGYQYNQLNQLAIITYPSGDRYRTDYDSRGRMLGEDNVDSSGNVLTAYASAIAYNPAQQVTGLTLGNTLTEAYNYDSGGVSTLLQLTNQTVNKGGSTLMNLSYNYHAAALASGAGTKAGNSGQLMAISSGSTINGQARDETFTYDNVGRLVTAAGYSTWQRRYAYDRYGNRTASWDAVSGGNQLQNITLGTTGGATNNRIATVNGVNYSYDASGNVLSDGAHSYQYDCEGRLAKVDPGTANEADYFYDLNNRRVKKVTGVGGLSPVTTYYVWNSGEVIAEFSTNAQTGNGVRYYHSDRLSTRMITDPNGNVLGTEDVLPFGDDAGTTAGAGVTDPYRFTTYNRDGETTSDYALNRQYPSGFGRFMQADPYSGSAFVTDPQTWNRYTYGWGDPINKIDPSGLDSLLFDGCKVTQLDDSGNVVQSWNSVSGKPGTSAADQSKKGEGPIPEGTYTVNPSDAQYRFDQKFVIYNPANPSGTWVYAHSLWATSELERIAWGDYRTELHADPGTNTFGRSGFFMHGGDVPGSAGCIDLTHQDKAFHDFLKGYGKPIKVIVKYTCNPWKMGANQSGGSGGGDPGISLGSGPGWNEFDVLFGPWEHTNIRMVPE
jgi:RHS repeat-associated protein